MKTRNATQRATNDESAVRRADERPSEKQVGEFEHKSVTLTEHGSLDDHVSGGWELVSTVRASQPDWVVHYLKRQKQ